MKKSLVGLSLAVFITGCATTDFVETPPKHMKRVQFVQYDHTVRPPTKEIEVLDALPTRKYKVIALITCEGAYHEEVVMTKAINFQARQLGADAVIILNANTAQTGSGSMYGGHVGGRALFKANAIVFE